MVVFDGKLPGSQEIPRIFPLPEARGNSESPQQMANLMTKHARFLLTLPLAATLLVGPSLLAADEDKAKKDGDKPNAEETEKVEVKSVFADKNFENAVRRQVFAKRDNDEPLTADDVRNISVIHGNNMEIKSLEGVQHCVSVAEIRLAENAIEDVSALKDLKRLQSLSLEKNKIKDITAIGTLAALQYLNLEHNSVRDLKPIKGLVKLNSVYLTDNKINDLSPLKDMKKVWSLYVADNSIEDISVVADLPWLQSLEIRDNSVKDVSALAKIREVRYMDIRNNNISDLSPLIEACEKDLKGDTRFAPFLRFYSKGNAGLETEDGKKQLATLKKIGVRLKDREEE